MDIYEFLTEAVQTEYTTVKVLKDSQRTHITLLRHERTGTPYVFRQFTGDGTVYRRLLQIKSPHLPQVFEVGEKDGRVAVLEEYIGGDNLAQLLETGHFSEQEVRKTAKEILMGLETLHAMGAVHRDIKPENVILRETGAVLIDFDASRIYKQAQTSDTHILGTTGYAAPEQFGVAQTDHRADIYAMGVLMNIMLTGQHPSRHMAEGRIGKIISRCTMMDPEKRYNSCRKLSDALDGRRSTLPAIVLSGILFLAILFVWLPRPNAEPLPPTESSLEEVLSSPEPSPVPSPLPSPSAEPSEAPAEETTTAEAVYEDEDGKYHLFLCFDAGMISRHIAQPDRLVELPPDTRTGCPSILTVYKEGSNEDATEAFSAKLQGYSVKAIPTGDGTAMELINAEITPEFAGALHMVSISMWTQNKENLIQWTLYMEDGQEIVLAQKLTVTESDSVTITSDNVDISTLEQLQQVIDYIGNDAGPGTTIDIYLPAVTYEGDLTIRNRGVNLYGDPAGTMLNGTVTVEVPIPEQVTLQDIVLTGNGGTGVSAHAPVYLINCLLSGYDTGAAAYDGGWITAQLTSFRENETGLYLNSSHSAHVDVGYPECRFENNGTAIRILAIDGNATMIFPGAVFAGNGQNIQNEIGYPVDMSDAVME